VSDEPGAAGEQGDLVSRLRAVIGAKDEQIAALTAALEASLDRERGLELRLAEVERRLSMDSTGAAISGVPCARDTRPYRGGRGTAATRLAAAGSADEKPTYRPTSLTRCQQASPGAGFCLSPTRDERKPGRTP
jgi:hypothetical protein